MSEWSWVSYLVGVMTPVFIVFAIATIKTFRSRGEVSGADSREPIKENIVVKKGS